MKTWGCLGLPEWLAYHMAVFPLKRFILAIEHELGLEWTVSGDTTITFERDVALSNTLLDPNSLFHSKRRIHVDLLQAIRERVMDNDLECAQAAAGCLANCVSFGAAGAQQQSVTASWIVVLTERLKVCLTQLKSRADNQAVKANEQLWWALTKQCLNAPCSLMEANPEALDRLTKNNSLATLLGLLELGARELEQNKSVAATEAADVSFQKYVAIYAAIYAARTMHAALDDNGV